MKKTWINDLIPQEVANQFFEDLLNLPTFYLNQDRIVVTLIGFPLMFLCFGFGPTLILSILLYFVVPQKKPNYYRPSLVKYSIDEIQSISCIVTKGALFEKFCANYLLDLGATDLVVTEAGNTPGLTSGDGGIDIFFHLDGRDYAADAKCYKENVSVEVVRNIYAASVLYSKKHHKDYHPMLITSSDYTIEAKRFARDMGVKLVNREDIIQQKIA